VQDKVCNLRERIARGQERIQLERLRNEKARKIENEPRAAAEHKARTNYTHLLTADVILLIAGQGLRERAGFGIKMAAVCRQWRQVVLSRPSLWGKLVLGAKRPVAKAALWMERSRRMLGEVVFEERFSVDNAAAVAEMLEVVVENVRVIEVRCAPERILRSWRGRCRRLEKLVVRLEAGTPGRPQFSLDCDLLHPTCTSLRHIDLSGIPEITYVLQPTPPSASSSAAMLSQRHVGTASRGASTCWMGNPDQMRHVRFLRLAHCTIVSSTSDPQYLLRHLVGIEEVHLQNVLWDGTAGTGEEAGLPELEDVHLDSLRTFCETSASLDNVHRFDRIKAPALSSLDMWRSNIFNPRHSLIEHIRAPGLASTLCNLQSLDIGKCVVDQAELLNLLVDLHALRFLNVSYCHLDNAFLEALTPKAEENYQKILLPNLTALSIAATEGITSGPLRDFVFSRLPVNLRPITRRSQASQTSQGSQAGQKRGSAFRPTAPSQPVKRSAFGPKPPVTSQYRSVNPSGSGKAAPQFSTSQARQPISRSASTSSQYTSTQNIRPPLTRITWLNVDLCERIEAALTCSLAKHVRMVSHVMGRAEEGRIRGKERWCWDGSWMEECEDGELGCRLRPIPDKPART
jgi:hypothetical protein